MNSRFLVYGLIIILLLVSIANIMQYSHKRTTYNQAQKEYYSLKTTYDENIKKMEQLGVGDNKARYFREQYNISKNGEILFEFPHENENISS